MGVSDILKQAGFTPEKSSVGDRPILKGVYKAMFVDGKLNEPNDYGQSYTAKFKVTETLAGTDSRSQFPEFVGFFAVDEKNANSAKRGIKKLINGFFSVGKTVDISSDEKMYESLDSLKGSAEVYISGYKKKSMKQVDGAWVENPDADVKQDFAFMTEKNALKEAEKVKAKQGHPL